MLITVHAQRPAYLLNTPQIADRRPRQIVLSDRPAACAALSHHESAVPCAARFGSGSGMAAKRGRAGAPVSGGIAVHVPAAVATLPDAGVPPRGCSG